MRIRRGHHVVAIDARIIKHIKLALLKVGVKRGVVEMVVIRPRGTAKQRDRKRRQHRAPQNPGGTLAGTDSLSPFMPTTQDHCALRVSILPLRPFPYVEREP